LRERSRSSIVGHSFFAHELRHAVIRGQEIPCSIRSGVVSPHGLDVVNGELAGISPIFQMARRISTESVENPVEKT
jgi:hypothetical protein